MKKVFSFAVAGAILLASQSSSCRKLPDFFTAITLKKHVDRSKKIREIKNKGLAAQGLFLTVEEGGEIVVVKLKAPEEYALRCLDNSSSDKNTLEIETSNGILALTLDHDGQLTVMTQLFQKSNDEDKVIGKNYKSTNKLKVPITLEDSVFHMSRDDDGNKFISLEVHTSDKS